MTAALTLSLSLPEMVPSLPASTPPGTDAANVHILAEIGFGQECRYVPGVGWRHYQGGVWRDVEKVDMLVKSVGDLLQDVVARYVVNRGVGDNHQVDTQALLRWWHDVGQTRTLLDTLKYASGEPRLVTRVEAWDPDPHLLNVQNGILDLITGDLSGHDPARLMTGQAGAEYDRNATHPTMDDLLAGLSSDGREDYLARAVGRALSGRLEAEEVHLLLGPGGSGKSSFVSAVQALLGSYAASLPIQALLVSSHGEATNAPRPYLMPLIGKRLAVAAEPPRVSRLNAALVKELSGRDRMAIRGLYGSPVEFTAACALWIHSNYDLVVDPQDDGMRRRLRVVPFEQVPVTERQDYKLELQSPVALSALLNWGQRGYQRWRRDGEHDDQGHSEVVRAATERYWERRTPLAAFLDECLVLQPGAFTPSEALQARLVTWVETQGLKDEPGTGIVDLRKILRAHGVVPFMEKKRRKGEKDVRGWKGVVPRGEDDLT